jgi:redox-sensing transcriptional repressor
VSQSKVPEPQESVPKSVVGRLCLYLREVQTLLREGQKTISSNRLGRRLGLTDAQVRKDLAHFGQFGYPGIGYRCDQLVDEIRKILGTDRTWSVALVGCGNLGQALLGYDGFQKQGFSIELAFDSSPGIIGRQFRKIVVAPMDRFETEIARRNIVMAILAVPSEFSQSVAERMVHSGIRGILNFAPVALVVPETVAVVSVDLANKLEQLAFTVVNELRK